MTARNFRAFRFSATWLVHGGEKVHRVTVVETSRARAVVAAREAFGVMFGHGVDRVSEDWVRLESESDPGCDQCDGSDGCECCPLTGDAS